MVSKAFKVYQNRSKDPVHWATSMPFASINPANPRTNLWNFREKFLRIGDYENLSFFESAILDFLFKKKKKIHENQSKFIW
jgi:hypothetical protein